MIGDADIAAVGALLGHEARVAMLNALFGGEATTASELARIAEVSRSGASAHLRKLREGGLITETIAGRNRFYRLAGSEVADALEGLARIAPIRRASGLRKSEATRALRRARTCYDHLAGELGVAVTEALIARRILRVDAGGFQVTGRGSSWFREVGVDLDAARSRRRSFVRGCLDWSERRPHLAGSVGAALADTFFASRWIRRLPGGRAIAVTAAGAEWLERELALDTAELYVPS